MSGNASTVMMSAAVVASIISASSASVSLIFCSGSITASTGDSFASDLGTNSGAWGRRSDKEIDDLAADPFNNEGISTILLYTMRRIRKEVDAGCLDDSWTR